MAKHSSCHLVTPLGLHRRHGRPPIRSSKDSPAKAMSSTLTWTPVDEGAYFDYETNRCSPESFALANEIALDWSYDGGLDHPAALERSAEAPRSRRCPSGQHSGLQRLVCGRGQGTGTLGTAACAPTSGGPRLRPPPMGRGVERLRRRTAWRVTVPALIWFTQQALFTMAETSGLIQRNEAEVKQAAQDALSRMTPLQRDVYGFASRNARRRQLAERYLENIRPSRHGLLIYWMSRFESEQSGTLRETRYATASRRLTGMGETRANISRLLGISTSVLDRIERENRSDVELADDDPILTDLAPSLRR